MYFFEYIINNKNKFVDRSGYVPIGETDNTVNNEPRYAVINSVQEEIQSALIS